MLRNFPPTPPQLFLACFEPIAAPLRSSQPYQREGFLRHAVDSPKGESPHLRLSLIVCMRKISTFALRRYTTSLS
ncbi:hypothetical protein HMPREF3185_01205 [Porphyromonas somerae]|uniref:Uncharacterized protein n=1 Tax=Porphyromonas somerae TaxID=322095 RepID=A0A134B7Y9_9PORP|nr:hypothetical protein HMPREF3184_01205 [Porphyromonadaceae bacterium KA00676]KXB76043.1 hypothetical protein HMPREF3185_01205 [Porphyromonas somerae]